MHLKPDNMKKARADACSLSRLCAQETPDPPEALTCMPSLQLSDIPRQASTIPTDVASSRDATILTHDLFTNNVIYAEAALDLRSLPVGLLPLVPLFCR
jgi:Zn-dependent M16 (insulinase) family peptidase